MKCKSCKREIDSDSFYCKWCGKAVIRGRKKKEEISVPKPRQLKSGEWFAQVMVAGERYPVKANTEAEYYTKARAVKQGLISGQKTKQGVTLKAACESFVSAREAVLSPSTIKGYENIIRNRFKAYMPKDIMQIDWQRMISDEAKVCNGKTLKNAWGFICSVLKANKIEKPDVRLPQVINKELPWLTPEQIPVFLDAVKGKPCELAALFALQGLRKSELLALTPERIVNGFIYVEGARVLNGNNELVYKAETKNVSSRRKVKLRIPRLKELLSASQTKPGEFYITGNPNNLHQEINAVCAAAGLPNVGCHGLRRSFASLAYALGWSERETMKDGGWSDFDVMHKRYIKLAESENDNADSMEEFFKTGKITNGITNNVEK